jgi:hypothetical protein
MKESNGHTTIAMLNSRIENISLPAPLRAVFLAVGRFPLSRDHSTALAASLQPWLRELAGEFDLQPAMWLQGTALYSRETVELVCNHAREWMPDLGLGIRPGGEPPHLLTEADLNKLKWNEMPKPKHETAFYLANGPQAAEAAFPLFCGTGAVVYCLLSASAEVFLREQRERWLPTIEDPAFRAHSFYLPFFGRKCLEDQSSRLLLKWMGPAIVYLRESIEDNGILILASRSEVIDRLDPQNIIQTTLPSTSGG